jgi:hypothetical protein
MKTLINKKGEETNQHHVPLDMIDNGTYTALRYDNDEKCYVLCDDVNEVDLVEYIGDDLDSGNFVIYEFDADGYMSPINTPEPIEECNVKPWWN